MRGCPLPADRTAATSLVKPARAQAAGDEVVDGRELGCALLRDRVEEHDEVELASVPLALAGELLADLHCRQRVAAHDLHQVEVQKTLVTAVHQLRAHELVGAEKVELEVVRLPDV